MSPAWHLLSVPDAKPKVGATLAALGSGQYDGHAGVLRIGTGIDAHTERFLWDSSARAGVGGWVGEQAYDVLTTDDAWALDWTRQPLSLIRGAWIRPNGGVGWARSGSAAILKNDVTVPATGAFTMDIHDYGATTIPAGGGNITVRGMIISYAARSGGAGTYQLTGCLYLGGAPAGVTLSGGATWNTAPTPIIPYTPVTGGGGDPGGWGTTVVPLDQAGAVWNAGFRLQERIHAWMNGSQDMKALSIAPWYLNYDVGDDFLYPLLSAAPPAGMLGPGITVTGVAQHMASITSPGSGSVVDERRFKWAETDWTAWAPAAPAKRLLVPILYGKMPVDANDTGQTYGVTLSLRWVQP